MHTDAAAVDHEDVHVWTFEYGAAEPAAGPQTSTSAAAAASDSAASLGGPAVSGGSDGTASSAADAAHFAPVHGGDQLQPEATPVPGADTAATDAASARAKSSIAPAEATAPGRDNGI